MAPGANFRTPMYRPNPANGGPIGGKNTFEKIARANCCWSQRFKRRVPGCWRVALKSVIPAAFQTGPWWHGQDDPANCTNCQRLWCSADLVVFQGRPSGQESARSWSQADQNRTGALAIPLVARLRDCETHRTKALCMVRNCASLFQSTSAAEETYHADATLRAPIPIGQKLPSAPRFYKPHEIFDEIFKKKLENFRGDFL